MTTSARFMFAAHVLAPIEMAEVATVAERFHTPACVLMFFFAPSRDNDGHVLCGVLPRRLVVAARVPTLTRPRWCV